MSRSTPPTSNKTPLPETRTALLASAGFPLLHKPKWTMHHYAETKLIKTEDGQVGWAHYYGCFRTGVRRKWGFEKTDEDLDLEAANPEVLEDEN